MLHIHIYIYERAKPFHKIKQCISEKPRNIVVVRSKLAGSFLEDAFDLLLMSVFVRVLKAVL